MDERGAYTRPFDRLRDRTPTEPLEAALRVPGTGRVWGDRGVAD